MNSPGNAPWVSLAEANRILADKDFDSTAETLDANYGRGEDERLWSLEAVEVVGIDPGQLIDDPNDVEAHAKVESIRASLRAGEFIPPVFLMHHSEKTHPYFLIEGRHRYNALHREKAVTAAAWIAHVSCDCVAPGGQDQDLG